MSEEIKLSKYRRSLQHLDYASVSFSYYYAMKYKKEVRPNIVELIEKIELLTPKPITAQEIVDEITEIAKENYEWLEIDKSNIFKSFDELFDMSDIEYIPHRLYTLLGQLIKQEEE